MLKHCVILYIGIFMAKKISNKITKVVASDVENGSRRQVIEELFYDLNRSRVQIYKINFIRGICFGFGTVLGGTVVVAVIIWLLVQFAGLFPSIGDFIYQIVNMMQNN